MKTTCKLIVLFITLSLLMVSCGNAQTRSAENYFRETGHFVNGEFLSFYNRVRDPLLVYGYPITEQFISGDGKTVQYFQRARFELVPDSQGMQSIQLTSMGLALHQPVTPLESKNPAACQILAGFQVCYDFLDFYNANGGAEQFGNPVSSAEEQAGLFVQYFEKARFEWRTDGYQNRVEITELGRSYFDFIGEDRALLDAVAPLDATINPVLSLNTRAFVSKSITRTNDDQTIFVIIQSQAGETLPNANVKISIRLTDGRVQEFTTATNGAGIANFSFNFDNQIAGELVQIAITADYLGSTGTTKTSFRIWY